MEKFNYTKLANTAKRLIDKFGTEVKFIRGSEAVTTIGVRTKFEKELIDGNTIKADDIKIDIVEIDGEKLGIVINPNIIKPSTVPIVYFVQVRK
jgi:hypothetical protein